MSQLMQDLLSSPGFMPHGYCLSWSPLLVWSMVGSDLIIGVAYYSIPIALLFFVRKHRELRFNWILVMFSMFIFACGTTHFIDIYNIWKPAYRLDAILKVLTAGVSIVTALALWPLLPKISAFMEDRRRAHAALEASNHELEQFAYAASHDLKAPLRTIASFTSLLQRRYRGKLDDNADEYLRFIAQSVAQMNALIDDLLQMSQVNSKIAEMAVVRTHDLVRGACDLLRNDIESSGAQVESGKLPVVQGDARLLTAVLQNLISNAIKFQRPASKPVVSIAALRAGDEWQFSVKDNGIGIAPEHLSRLFHIFKRLHTAEEYPGTGIGLALCKKIIGLHNGRIWVESRPGEGSTFWFSLPAAITTPVETAAPQALKAA